MGKRKLYQAVESPVTITSQGAQLVGMLHRVDSGKIVIMCHGFTGNKSESKRLFVEAARDMASRGYNVLRFDFYGSGDSEGDFKDFLISRTIANLQDVIEWVREHYEQIVVLGLSLGAATAILTLLETPVDGLVCWSAVPDTHKLYDLFADHLYESGDETESFEYDGWQLSRDFFTDANAFDVKGVLARLELPKCFMQGTADASFFTDGFADFQQLVIPPADFMQFPDAGHTFQKPVHRRQIIKQTTRWLLRHI